LWSWGQVYLNRDLLPKDRVVVRFDFEYRGRPDAAWLLIHEGDAELCTTDPGYGEDLVVEVKDAMVFARWHLGHIDWANALRSGGITVTGSSDLRKALRGIADPKLANASATPKAMPDSPPTSSTTSKTKLSRLEDLTSRVHQSAGHDQHAIRTQQGRSARVATLDDVASCLKTVAWDWDIRLERLRRLES
jgi:hypothetical protein